VDAKRGKLAPPDQARIGRNNRYLKNTSGGGTAPCADLATRRHFASPSASEGFRTLAL